MKDFFKLVFDKILILWKYWNPAAIQEFHIYFAKIIFVLSNLFPLFQQIFIFYFKIYSDNTFFVTVTIVLNRTDNFLGLIFTHFFEQNNLKIFHKFFNIHNLNKFSAKKTQSTNKIICSRLFFYSSSFCYQSYFLLT